MPFSGPKWFLCPKQFFLGTNHYSCFHLPVGPFHCANFAKHFYSGSKVLRMHLFWAQNAPFLPSPSPPPPQKKKIISFFENYYYHFHLPISPFHCAKFQKILFADPELLGCAIFGPKMTHLPKWEFFREPFYEPCSFHSCLST